MKLNLLVYAVIGVLALGSVFYIARDVLANGPLVGDCATQVKNVTELKIEEAGCRSSKVRMSSAEFEVGEIGTTCPAGDYLAVPRDDEKTCYVFRANVGACFVSKDYPNTDQLVLVRGDCKAPGARKSVDILHDTFDKSRCANEELSLAYSEPARTICMDKP